MVKKKICLDTVDKVQALVGAATSADFEVSVLTDRFTVNAKSILGLFSLDRSKPVDLILDTDESDGAVEVFMSRVGEYIIEQ